jgi:hypothetical protein
MQQHKHYPNPTPPVRCSVSALSNPNDGVEVKVRCNKRVVRNGTCGLHYEDSRKGREYRRLHVTRHRLGIDPETGSMVYGTKEPADEKHWCHRLTCRRPPVINMEGILYCEKDFMLEQRKRKVVM